MSDAFVSLKKLARNRRFDELESGLLEAIEADEVDREDLVSVLNLAAHRGESDALDSLFWLALTSFAEKHGAEEGLAAAREAAPLFPQAETVREDLAGLYAAAHPEYPGADALARRLLTASGLSLPDALARTDALLALPPGTFVLARHAKTPGRVVGLGPEGDSILVEQDGGEKAVDLEAAAKLSPLDGEDYRALAAFDPDRFRAYAEESPAALVETVLRLHGPRLTYRDLRAQLVDLLPMPWAGWWNDARPRLRRSPWIDMTASNQPTLELRRVPLSHEDEIRESLAEASGFGKITVVLDFLDESGEHAANEEGLLRHFAETLAGLGAGPDAPLAIASLAVLEEIRDLAPDALADVEVPDLPDAAAPDLMAPLGTARLEDSVLDLVRRRREETWIDFFSEALPVLTPEGCERVAVDLEAAGRGDALLEASRKIMASPRRYPGGLVWVWKRAGAGGLPAENGGPERGELFAHLVAAMDRASRGPEGRGALYSLYQSAISASNWSVARRTLEQTDLDGARAVKEVIERSHGITDHMKVKLQDLLVESHPEVFATDTPPWLRDDVIYSTAAGLEKKQAEYSKLVNERLPEIAEAVGRAASFGDLSENAEYTAALEERERMTERANALKADLDKAVVIPEEMAAADVVTVGTRVHARNVETEEERTFVFLGPWDVDVPRGVYSYRAPLSHAFMGRSAGDVVTIPADGGEQDFEILEIASALA